MKKKVIWFILCVFIIFQFSSCDEIYDLLFGGGSPPRPPANTNQQGTQINSPIVGIWNENGGDRYILHISSNGRLFAGWQQSSFFGEATYTVSGNTINIKFIAVPGDSGNFERVNHPSDAITFNINGNTLSMNIFGKARTFTREQGVPRSQSFL